MSVNDPHDITPRQFAGPPWSVADGVGTVICAGDDPSRPGEILFALRAPIGVQAPFPHELLAEYAAFVVMACNKHHELVRTLQDIMNHSSDALAENAARVALA